jgi:hypothetical protein
MNIPLCTNEFLEHKFVPVCVDEGMNVIIRHRLRDKVRQEERSVLVNIESNGTSSLKYLVCLHDFVPKIVGPD